MSDTLRLVLNERSVLGEGAIWDQGEQVLYWVDIDLGLVHIYDPASRTNRSLPAGQPVGSVVRRAAGGLMLAVRDGFMSLDLKTGKTALVAAPQGHRSENRFNDGKCDPAGRFWAGTVEAPGRKGALFRLDRDLSVHRMLDGISCSNGIAWSSDGKTMYYIDSPTKKIEAFEYELKTGAISNRRTVVSIAEEHGVPDGMTIDSDGNLWVAHWDGWCVCCWSPATGRLVRKVRLPVALPTSCAFGDVALDTLYITSASFRLDRTAMAKQPEAGGLFCFKPGVRGLPAFSFVG